MTPLEQAIEFIGSKSALARALGVSPGAVTNWITRGKVPGDRCIDIETLTLGAVTATQLRSASEAR